MWSQFTCSLTDEWIKNFVLYTHNVLQFSVLIKGNTVIYNNIYESWEHYAEWNKLVIEGQLLYDSTYIESK